MKLRPHWLWLAPAAALFLIAGPLSTSAGANPKNGAAPQEPPASTTPAAQAPGATGLPALPKAPDPWQLASTVAGVLLLGLVVVVLARKLRQGGATGPAAPAALRQSLRLGPKHFLHVVEFDDRLLLVGAGDGGVALLDQSRSPDLAQDEAAVAARAEDGAVPKDLVIPRPDQPPPVRRPTPPGQRSSKALGDFRALLQKAGRS